jgi:hypothetical protein
LGIAVTHVATARPSLKEKNAKSLLALLALNLAAFYFVENAMEISVTGWAALATGWLSALPAGAGIVVTAVLNGQVSADTKARLVFLRWRFPYPGSKAFSQYGPSDARVNMTALANTYGPLPSEPGAQNALWYKLYRTVADFTSIEQVHGEFLLARDYAFMALLLLAGLGTLSLATIPLRTAAIYLALLLLQWAIAARAANVTGKRFVTCVLAIKSAEAR